VFCECDVKKGAILGGCGCLLWLAALIIRDKQYETFQLIFTLVGVPLVIIGTVLMGIAKRRTALGVFLSVLAVAFGLGFFIMLLVPRKELQPA
jgi:hypothetical protein